MFTYTLTQWLLFFYFYCLIGWIWESCYVSLKQHKWINRGFLHGPFLPIYGCGAIFVLMITIPFTYSRVLVYLIGMLSATALEYVAGVLTHKLFHVRYWDYSYRRIQFQGHICLVSSLGWGVFSVLMDFVAHPAIASVLLRLPENLMQYVVYSATILFTVDFVKSFQEALDLKELLGKLTSSTDEVKWFQKQLDSITSILNEKRSYTFSFASLEETINHYLKRTESLPENAISKKDEITSQLLELKEKLVNSYNRLFERSEKEVASSLRILKRNPTSISDDYAEAMKLLKALEKNRKKQKRDI